MSPADWRRDWERLRTALAALGAARREHRDSMDERDHAAVFMSKVRLARASERQQKAADGERKALGVVLALADDIAAEERERSEEARDVGRTNG